MQLFANGYLSNFGVLMKNIWEMKCTCSFVSSKGGLFSDMVQSLIILPSRRAAILCFFTVYFGLFVVVKPKKTLSGLHWLSFSFERSRISTGEVSSWGRMNHLSCRHSHYLPRAAGGWIGFTEDIHGLWLRLDLKEMFLKMTFKNRKVSFVLMCDNLVHRVNCPSATIWSHYGQCIITFPINHVHQTFFPISLSMRYLQLRTEPVLKSTNDLLRCDNLADWSRLFFFR